MTYVDEKVLLYATGALLELAEAIKSFNPSQPRDKFGRWISGILDVILPDDAEKAAILAYKGSGFRDMNKFLRGRPQRFLEAFKTEKDMQGAIRSLDVFIGKQATKSDVKLYRKIGSDVFGSDGPKIGTSFVDKGYVSTNKSHFGMDTFRPDGWLVDIAVPKGTPAADIEEYRSKGQHGWEREVLLPRGQKFRVTRTNKRRRRISMLLEPAAKSDAMAMRSDDDSRFFWTAADIQLGGKE